MSSPVCAGVVLWKYPERSRPSVAFQLILCTEACDASVHRREVTLAWVVRSIRLMVGAFLGVSGRLRMSYEAEVEAAVRYVCMVINVFASGERTRER